MNDRKSTQRSTDSEALDLQEYGVTLTRLLPILLFSRDREALVRWCRARSWVDNALAGDLVADLAALSLAVAYLVERSEDG